jgi:hypothetical protein
MTDTEQPHLEFGIDRFGDLPRDDDGHLVSTAKAIRATVAEAIIGGAPERFAPYVELYRRATEQFGTTAYPVGMHAPGFIADTDEAAKELYYPGHKQLMDTIGRERGWPPRRREQFEAEIEHGSLYVGAHPCRRRDRRSSRS